MEKKEIRETLGIMASDDQRFTKNKDPRKFIEDMFQ